MKGNSTAGFSLIESLLCLLIFCFVFLACISFAGTLQNQFVELKQEMECDETALFLLDRITKDLEQAGEGLLIPISLGLLEGLKIEENGFEIKSMEAEIPLLGNLYPGQTRITLDKTSALKKNRLICVHDSTQGEIKTISSIDDLSIVLFSPLQNGYIKDETKMLIIREVIIFPDSDSAMLRRKVNTSSAQPLAEEVHDFSCAYDPESHLTEIRLVLDLDEEKKYECFLSPKNLSLALHF